MSLFTHLPELHSAVKRVLEVREIFPSFDCEG